MIADSGREFDVEYNPAVIYIDPAGFLFTGQINFKKII